jgi:site-specific recombinase XerD
MFDDKQNCADLTAKMLSEMKLDNYSYKVTSRSVNYIYRALNRFCDDNYEGMYSSDAGLAFIESNAGRVPALSKAHMNTYKNSITRLDYALDGDYHWRPVSKEMQAYASSCFNGIVKEYEDYLVQTRKTKPDIRSRIHILARFLAHVESSGITKIDSITASVIYSGFEQTGSKDEFCKSVKSFFRYVYRMNLLNKDISFLVPEYTRHRPIPTVYTSDEVTVILESIDRSTDAGKRNYCIVLIAARLGLRSCDIAGLTFENICTTDNSIRLIQKKTCEPISFPLLTEIKDALDDYTNHARPSSNEPYLFMNVPQPSVRPLTSNNIYTIVSRIIDKSEVNTTNKRRGAHALRSSLASQLLEEGNSYSVIQKVLGHTSPEAAKHYVKIEIDKLRECALEVPAIQNNLLNEFFRKAGV